MIQDLAWVPIFENLEKEDLAKLAKIAKKKTLGPKTVVFFEGDRADAFYVVVSGSLKVYQTSQDGREKVLNTMGPGEIFGELAMLDGKPRSASVETIEAAELIVMARADFRQVATATPSILWGVLEGLCDRLRSLNDMQVDAAFHDTPYRIAKAVVKLADKHGEKTADGWRVRESFGVKNLADMAATTPARVSRVLEKLEDDGLIQTGKEEILVPDLAALKRAIDYMGSR
jgi:CRP/FNR family transcriptional regulator, cyclic AMP receptor protein